MIAGVPSTLSLIAAAYYGWVAACCLLAMATANGRKQVRWHGVSWLLLALLFTGLALMRVFAIEDLLREELRLLLRIEGTYDDRRALQGPVFAGLFITAAAIAGFWAYRITRAMNGRRNFAAAFANAGGCCLVFLLLLRIVSLHSVDQLLYGPLKLNWVIDLGTSTVVLVCAVQYWRVVSGRLR